MEQINIHEAKTTLSRLVDRASEGEEIIIAKAGKPMAKLVPLEDTSRPRKPGSMKGRVKIHKTFYDPLPDEILKAFEGR